VNVVPICHLKTMKSVPEEEFVVSIHWHFRQLVKIGRNFAICHGMGLSICYGRLAAVIGFVSFPAKLASPVSSTRTVSLGPRGSRRCQPVYVTIGFSNEIRDSNVDCQSYVAFVIEE
ncbi:MAG: hypothetical protein QOE55_2559, partial [Acidobacteriaceae bacterium]|nr:hypothetical protein [Acidobacteriaceae bacterium]